MNRPITPQNFDSFHEDAIEGATPGPWDGYSRLDRLDGLDTRTVDDLINAPHRPVPARPVVRQAHKPVEPWSLTLTLMLIVPPVVAMVVLVALLIVDMVTW
jgi:hypothetical protein